jgi:dephospho-CoA kinase
MKYFKDKIVIGVTGGIGSGKSIVCRKLALDGFQVIYADDIAKELYVKDKELIEKIIKLFSSEIVNYKGKIILSKLKELIFRNKTNYLKVIKLVHPRVIKYMLDKIKKSKSKIIIVEAALIFESNFDKYLDFVVTVYSPKIVRIERIMKRDGISRKLINDIIKFQMDDKEKCKKSDFIMLNNKRENDLAAKSGILQNLIEKLK